MTVSPVAFVGRVVNGATPTSTGTVSYTSAGMGDPKGALIIGARADALATTRAGWSHTWGVTDGTNQRVAYTASRDAVTTGVSKGAGINGSMFRLIDPATNVVVVEGVFSAWTTDGITINWTTVDSTAWLFSILLLGGSQCEVYVTEALPPGTPFTGATTITPGFATDFVLTHTMESNDGTMINQGEHCPGFSWKNGGSPVNYSVQLEIDRGTTSNGRTIANSAGLGTVMTLPGGGGDTVTNDTQINNYTSTTVDVINGAGSNQGARIAMMCVKTGGAVSVGIAAHQDTIPTSTGNVDYTFPGFKSGVVVALFCNNNAVADQANATGGIGITDIWFNSGCVWTGGRTNVTTSKTTSLKSNVLMDSWNAAVTNHEFSSAVVSQLSTGHRLNHNPAPAAARVIYQLVIEDVPLYATGTAAGATAVTGTLLGAGALVGSSAGSTVVAATIKGTGNLTATSAGATAVSGTLLGAGALTGTAAGATAASGTLLAAGALTGTAAGATAASGTLSGAGALTGSTSGATAVSGLLTGNGAMIGTSAGATLASGLLTGTGDLTGTSAGQTAVTGLLTGDAALTGTAAGATSATSLLLGAGALTGSAAGATAANGVLLTQSQLMGTASGATAASGLLTGTGNLVGTAAGATLVAGLLTGYAFLTGAANGTTLVQGILGVPSPACILEFDGGWNQLSLFDGSSSLVAELDAGYNAVAEMEGTVC